MSGINRLGPASDPGGDGRGQLQETLDVMANAIKRLREELDLVKDADKIVRPVPIEAFPVAAGQIYTGEEGGEIGDIVFRAKNAAPVGMLPCDGAEYYYPSTAYEDLYNAIGTTYNTGGETSSFYFRVPDLKGRVPVGIGQCSVGTPATWTLGQRRGDDRSEAHAHTGPDHNHTITHSHSFYTYNAGGTGSTWRAAGTLALTASPNSDGTDTQSTGNSGNAGTGSTSTAFAGTDKNLQPSLGLAPFIRYRLGPSDEIQTLPISWGSINGQWQLDTLTNFPKSAVSNLDVEVVANQIPEAVVKITAVNGAQSGSSGTSNKIVGVVRVPYNFRGWRPNALVIRTKVDSTGVGSNSCTVTLKVSDPLYPGLYLDRTYSRTISPSAGALSEDYTDCVLTAEDLGRTWKPGYLFRFELIFDHPRTFTTANLHVGRLELNWR